MKRPDAAPEATDSGGFRHRLRAFDPKPDEILVLAFLLALIGFASLFAEAPGFESLHNSRLTLITLLVMVAALPAMIAAGIHARGPLVAVRAWLPLVLGLLCYENLKHLHANNITLAPGIEPREVFMLHLDELLFARRRLFHAHLKTACWWPLTSHRMPTMAVIFCSSAMHASI